MKLKMTNSAVTRATRRELAIYGVDEEFWPDVLSRVAGGESLKKICDERCWQYGEVYRTIRADDDLSAAYDEAKRGQAEFKVDEAMELVDDAKKVDEVGLVKMKSDFGLRLAGKWDRGRYGEKMEVEHRGVPVLVIEVGGAEKALPEKVVEGQVVEGAVDG